MFEIIYLDDTIKYFDSIRIFFYHAVSVIVLSGVISFVWRSEIWQFYTTYLNVFHYLLYF